MKLLRYIAGISSLACLGVHLSSFSGVSPCSELQLLCAHVLYGWQGALSSAWAHLLPTQSFSTTFKNMLYILKVTTMCLGSIWIKRQDLISYQKKEILWYMWCGCFFGFVFFLLFWVFVCLFVFGLVLVLGFFLNFSLDWVFLNISLIVWTEPRHLFLVFVVNLIYYWLLYLLVWRIHYYLFYFNGIFFWP